jgi:1-acyl-sn-glycerol-3-phosphate acyltransferase
MINFAIRGVSRAICRVDDFELVKVPMHGPLILAVNHVNFLDAPLLYTHLLPRPITGLVKKETWDNPFLGALFSMWKAIPIRRGEADLGAIQKARQALAERQILVVAPEGTRSKSGRLQRGKPGFALLAAMTKTPILPLAFYGGEVVWDNMFRLARTDFHIRVGEVYTLKDGIDIKEKEVRATVTDEIMTLVADLLPERYRGYYSKSVKSPISCIEKVN